MVLITPLYLFNIYVSSAIIYYSSSSSSSDSSQYSSSASLASAPSSPRLVFCFTFFDKKT